MRRNSDTFGQPVALWTAKSNNAGESRESRFHNRASESGEAGADGDGLISDYKKIGPLSDSRHPVRSPGEATQTVDCGQRSPLIRASPVSPGIAFI